MRLTSAATTYRNKAVVTGGLRITYMGDEGGIVCKLDLGSNAGKEAFTSITHLRFDPRLALTRDIAAYQKHRLKRLRRQPS